MKTFIYSPHCAIHFIMIVWNRTYDILEVCRYILLTKPRSNYAIKESEYKTRKGISDSPFETKCNLKFTHLKLIHTYLKQAHITETHTLSKLASSERARKLVSYFLLLYFPF